MSVRGCNRTSVSTLTKTWLGFWNISTVMLLRNGEHNGLRTAMQRSVRRKCWFLEKKRYFICARLSCSWVAVHHSLATLCAHAAVFSENRVHLFQRRAAAALLWEAALAYAPSKRDGLSLLHQQVQTLGRRHKVCRAGKDCDGTGVFGPFKPDVHRQP